MSGFLLDDGGDLGRAGRGAEDAAVAGGIRRDGGEDGHGGVLGEMQFAERRERFRPDERDVAGEHEQMPGSAAAGEFEGRP